MTIQQLPAAPQPTDSQSSFNTKAFALVAGLNTFVNEVNATATTVGADAATAADKANTTIVKAAETLASAAAALLSANNAHASEVAAATSAGSAHTSEVAAAASAASAAAIAGSFAGTSATSLTVGTGNKTFETQSGEQYSKGIWITAVSAADGSNFMFGQVVSYTGTSLVLNVQATGGSGTFADWNLSLAGPRGAPGATGAPGTGITPQSVGFSMTGGSTSSKTLVVDENLVVSELTKKLSSQATSYATFLKFA